MTTTSLLVCDQCGQELTGAHATSANGVVLRLVCPACSAAPPAVSMTPPPKPPAKHLPHGNYARADWFEARCRLLEAQLTELKAKSFDQVAGERDDWKALAGRQSAQLAEQQDCVTREQAYNEVADWLERIAITKAHGARGQLGDMFASTQSDVLKEMCALLRNNPEVVRT